MSMGVVKIDIICAMIDRQLKKCMNNNHDSKIEELVKLAETDAWEGVRINRITDVNGRRTCNETRRCSDEPSRSRFLRNCIGDN